MDRKTGIGGSECAAVLGLSRWKTPYQVFVDKANTDEESNKIDNDAMRWGRALEPLVIKEYQERTGNEVELLTNPAGEQTTFKSKKYPWLIAHVDGMIKNKPLIIEVKTTRFFGDDWGDEGSDKIPIEYLLQCAHYCLVLGEERDISGVEVAALGSTSEFRLYRYNRNEKLEKKIIDGTEKFWNENVLARIPPTPGFGDDLAKIYSKCIDGVVIASLNEFEACTELSKIKKEIELLEQNEETLKQVIQLTMQEKDTLIDTAGNVLATWKASESKRLNQKKLKESGIDLSDYYDKIFTRKFLIKKDKHGE